MLLKQYFSQCEIKELDSSVTAAAGTKLLQIVSVAVCNWNVESHETVCIVQDVHVNLGLLRRRFVCFKVTHAHSQ